ncbi:MAG: Gfo/Idh/MocA family oxidoreductase [bacterium]|nr:Gfo/Idh/MocA family oxidoreductase [bacterium]
MINIGIIGTGFGAKIHIPSFKKAKGARVLGLASGTFKKTEEVARINKIPLVFKSWQELARCPKIDAVSITAPPPLHAPIALEAIRNGKHVFCEKPLAMNVREAQKMLEAAKRAKIVHMIDFEFREIPHFIYFREMLKKKTLGSLRYINILWLTGGRAKPNLAVNWQNYAKAGGGALFNFGSHVADYIEWIFGPIRKVEARLSIAKKYSAKKRVTAEDTFDILGNLKDGTPINIAVSNVSAAGPGHQIEVWGEKGVLKLSNPNLRDAVYGFELWQGKIGDDKMTKIALPKKFGRLKKYPDGRLPVFIKTAQKFIRAIEMRKNARPSFEDGTRTQIVMEAVRKSSRAGKQITLLR